MKEKFSENIGAFEEVLQNIAGDIARGILHEKLTPSELLQKTDKYADRLRELTVSGEEFMLVLKPERVPTIQARSQNLTQTLTTFKDILVQNTADPAANSRLAFEQLRKALTDASEFLLLMREARDNPSPILDAVLTLKKVADTKGSVISIQTREDLQPLVKYVFSRMDEFETSVEGLEKKVDEMKEVLREFREKSLQILSEKTSTAPESKGEKNKTENKQLPLSSFNAERN